MNTVALFLNFYVVKMAKLKLFHVIIIIHKYLATCEHSCHSSNTKKGVLIGQKTVSCSCKFPDVLQTQVHLNQKIFLARWVALNEFRSDTHSTPLALEHTEISLSVVGSESSVWT